MQNGNVIQKTKTTGNQSVNGYIKCRRDLFSTDLQNGDESIKLNKGVSSDMKMRQNGEATPEVDVATNNNEDERGVNVRNDNAGQMSGDMRKVSPEKLTKNTVTRENQLNAFASDNIQPIKMRGKLVRVNKPLTDNVNENITYAKVTGEVRTIDIASDKTLKIFPKLNNRIISDRTTQNNLEVTIRKNASAEKQKSSNTRAVTPEAQVRELQLATDKSEGA